MNKIIMTCAYVGMMAQLAIGEMKSSLSVTNDSIESSNVVRLVTEMAPRIEERNYRSLAFDAKYISAKGSLVLYFRFKRPDKYTFVVMSERDSIPVLLATRESYVIYDAGKDQLRYYTERNSLQINFGIKAGALSLGWYLGLGKRSDQTFRLVLLDFEGVMSKVEKNQEVKHGAHDDEWIFTGRSKKGSGCTVVYAPKELIPYRSAEFDLSDAKICFASILGDVAIDDSVFEWRNGDLVKTGLMAQAVDQSLTGRVAVTMQNMLSQVQSLDPVSGSPRLRGPSDTARMFKESVQKMIEPVTGTNGLSHIE